MTFGNRLRRLRKEMALTQQQLAKRAGLSQAAVSDYESGKITNPRSDELMRLAAILRTTPDYLMSGIGSSNIADSATDESALLEAFNQLNTSSRAALIAAAQAMKTNNK